MNRPLRLTGCSLRVSLVGVVYLRIVCCVFRWWMWCICGLFAMYFVVWMLRYSNLFAIFWQFVSSCRGRFIVPAYSYTPTKCGTKMYVRWNKCTYFMKRIYIFDNVEIRARWICPYAWRIVRCEFHCVNVGLFQFARNILAAHLWRIVCVFMVYLNSGVGLLFCKMMVCVL